MPDFKDYPQYTLLNHSHITHSSTSPTSSHLIPTPQSCSSQPPSSPSWPPPVSQSLHLSRPVKQTAHPAPSSKKATTSGRSPNSTPASQTASTRKPTRSTSTSQPPTMEPLTSNAQHRRTQSKMESTTSAARIRSSASRSNQIAMVCC
jgi:hypothetical protein